jgi:ribonuclease HII
VTPARRAVRRAARRNCAPTLRVERALAREGYLRVAGVDEVGRGALSGPVTVGMVVAGRRRPPAGLRDSKLLTPAAREALVPRILRWVDSWAVGHAGPEEVDSHGIIAALRLAANRALRALAARPDCLLLDGNYDYIAVGARSASDPSPDPVPEPIPPVRTMIKADMRCTSVAAASVLAKTSRDAIMGELAARHPGYGWEFNRGYATPAHLAALRRLGPCEQHRRTWRLLGPDELAAALLDEEAVAEQEALAEEGLVEDGLVGGRLVEGRLVEGRLVEGRLVEGGLADGALDGGWLAGGAWAAGAGGEGATGCGGGQCPESGANRSQEPGR